MNDPTFLLRTYLEEEVVVTSKEMDVIPCVLHAFDEHLNVLVTRTDGIDAGRTLFFRGETINHIRKPKKTRESSQDQKP